MFEVRTETAKLLYRAQHRQLRGRLRLDLSSRRFPADPTRPLDVACAREAIGERVVQTVRGCANDAALLARDGAGFDKEAVPPRPDKKNRLRVMPDPSHFEQFVARRLDELLGLDRDSAGYCPAQTHLAQDFFGWVSKGSEAGQTYGIVAEAKQVFVHCDAPGPEDFSPLGPAQFGRLDEQPRR
jgi:hypothetical protein